MGLLCSITYLVDLPALGDFFELLMDMPIEMVTMINSTIPAGVIFFFATFTPMMQRKFAQQIGFKTSSAITVYACRMLMLFDFVSIILGPAMLIGICSGGQDFVKRIGMKSYVYATQRVLVYSEHTIHQI